MVLNRSRSSERVDILERDLGTKTATDVTATGTKIVGKQISRGTAEHSAQVL